MPPPNPPTHPGAAGVTQRRRPPAAKPSPPDRCHTSPPQGLRRPRALRPDPAATPHAGEKSKRAAPSREPSAARRCGARGKRSPGAGTGRGWGARLTCHTAKTLERKSAAAAGRFPSAGAGIPALAAPRSSSGRPRVPAHSPALISAAALSRVAGAGRQPDARVGRCSACRRDGPAARPQRRRSPSARQPRPAGPAPQAPPHSEATPLPSRRPLSPRPYTGCTLGNVGPEPRSSLLGATCRPQGGTTVPAGCAARVCAGGRRRCGLPQPSRRCLCGAVRAAWLDGWRPGHRRLPRAHERARSAAG